MSLQMCIAAGDPQQSATPVVNVGIQLSPASGNDVFFRQQITSIVDIRVTSYTP